MKQVLVYKGKHDTKIFDYSTRDQQKKSLKRMFKDIKEYEYYYRISDDSSIKEVQQELKDIETDLSTMFKIPIVSNQLRIALDDLKKTAQSLSKELNDLREERALYKLANKGDVKAIYQLLHRRRELEYERFSIEYMV